MDFDISNFIKVLECNCRKIQIKTFEKGETVTTYVEKRNQLCIISEGAVDLIRYDRYGNKTIIGNFIKNDILGELFYPASTNNELFITACKKSKIIFFNYDDIHQKCKRNCSFHQELFSNLSELFLKEIIDLNTRIELLSNKTIRDKLLTYFNILSTKSMSRTFKLSYSLTDLADYLCVNRSAMMREIKLLLEEGFIKKNKNRITLLYK